MKTLRIHIRPGTSKKALLEVINKLPDNAVVSCVTGLTRYTMVRHGIIAFDVDENKKGKK